MMALRELLAAQAHVCALSGLPLTPENATVDHKKACSEGGSNAVENLQWVLKTVNKAKGAMSVEEFVSMCCHVADHARAGSAGSLVGSRGSETENSAAD